MPESPIRHSGSPLPTQAQVASSAMTATKAAPTRPRRSPPGWPAAPGPHALHPDQLQRVNQVERWFAYITADLLRRSDHRSVYALNADTRACDTNWKANPQPFI